MSWNIPRTVAVLVLCTTLVAPQTFQYSRGWTNGRKRGGVAPITRVDHDAVVPGIIVGPLVDPRTGLRGMAAAVFSDIMPLSASEICQRYQASSTPPSAASEDSMPARFRDIMTARAPPQPAKEWTANEDIERRRRETEGTATTSSET